jgi:hypothetical protein
VLIPPRHAGRGFVERVEIGREPLQNFATGGEDHVLEQLDVDRAGTGSTLDSAKRLAQVPVVRIREQPVERTIGDPHSREHCRRSVFAVRLRQHPRQRRQPCKHADERRPPSRQAGR